ncbi:hypothetical protein PH190_26015 [Actinomycetospora straminea]|uniref:UGSC-like domain-containing protein n=2 Tax=Actinomycetospora straminea TaxID=663607 RepID=A0ABP9DRW1_9PSEU|nr:hypothetical protein [Actinomycetospora straminea]MDD7935906.1 hypothetical protein [Actinomycetospora straminea]
MDSPVTVVLDPTDESRPAARTVGPRPDDLAGRTVGLLDIAKPRGDVFLDRLADLLTERGATVRRYAKPTFTKPMPTDLRAEITAECDVVIEALAD